MNTDKTFAAGAAALAEVFRLLFVSASRKKVNLLSFT